MSVEGNPILTQLAVVDGIEEDHGGGDHLEEWRHTRSLRLDVLVVPAPPGSAERSGQSPRTLLTTSEPGGQLSDLHLTEWGVGCGQSHSQLIPLNQIPGEINNNRDLGGDSQPMKTNAYFGYVITFNGRADKVVPILPIQLYLRLP